jgi:hypothetical protein
MIKIDHTTMAPTPSLGWYEINNTVFWNKASALLAGSKLGLKNSDLHWNFNDAVFDKFDWTVEPPGDIRNYYHARARQLREKYDYLILNFSGGSDSATVLYSFIQQGLFLDEVVVRHATTGTNNYAPDEKNLDASNEFSEFEFAARPLLKWLATVSPKTKITIHDFSKDIINDNLVWDENFIYWTGDYISPGCIVRFGHATNKDHLLQFDKGKKVGLIFGVDKPRVQMENDNIYLRFVDRPVHAALPSTVNNGYTNTTVELFFWSPELPELISKQCHLIKQWFEIEANQRMSYMLRPEWQMSSTNRTIYEAFIKGTIYPDYDLTTFQCNKPVKSTFQEWDYWLNDFKNTSGYKTFMRGMIHLYKNIDHEFLKRDAFNLQPNTELNSLNWEFRPCTSKPHYIGKFKKL